MSIFDQHLKEIEDDWRNGLQVEPDGKGGAIIRISASVLGDLTAGNVVRGLEVGTEGDIIDLLEQAAAMRGEGVVP